MSTENPPSEPEKQQLEPTAEHPITITPKNGRVVVRAGDVTIADTEKALSLAESNYPPVLYIPLADVAPTQLERTDYATYCPYKGDAGYYSLSALGSLGENAVWEYADPFPAVEAIKGTVAFYADRVEISES
jgi:uncharacterized protein (DUF427 family)